MSLRGFLLGRSLQHLITNSSKNSIKLQFTRNSGHAVNYRLPPPSHPKSVTLGAELVGAAMWYWVLYHLYHDYGHITGEFEYPNPKKWSDKELGIPKFDE